MKKIIFVFVFMLLFISCSTNLNQDYIVSIYNEANQIISTEKFVEPIKNGDYYVDLEYFRYGYVKNPLTGLIFFKYAAWLFAKENTEVINICNGKIMKIGHVDNSVQSEIIVKNGDFLISYLSVLPNDKIKVGECLNKGDIIGYVKFDGGTLGPRLSIKILYKSIYLDPILMLNLSNPTNASSGQS